MEAASWWQQNHRSFEK